MLRKQTLGEKKVAHTKENEIVTITIKTAKNVQATQRRALSFMYKRLSVVAMSELSRGSCRAIGDCSHLQYIVNFGVGPHTRSFACGYFRVKTQISFGRSLLFNTSPFGSQQSDSRTGVNVPSVSQTSQLASQCIVRSSRLSSKQVSSAFGNSISARHCRHCNDQQTRMHSSVAMDDSMRNDQEVVMTAVAKWGQALMF
eukprot:4908304-Amphidinium_carterae.1